VIGSSTQRWPLMMPFAKCERKNSQGRCRGAKHWATIRNREGIIASPSTFWGEAMTEHPERRQNDIETALLRRDVEALTEKVDLLSRQVSDLVRAWETATYIVAVVKWMAGMASAITIIWAALKGFKQ